ncbi:hypothetical protein ACLB2K_068760 [Fragaria x ananassa]
MGAWDQILDISSARLKPLIEDVSQENSKALDLQKKQLEMLGMQMKNGAQRFIDGLVTKSTDTQPTKLDESLQSSKAVKCTRSAGSKGCEETSVMYVRWWRQLKD